MENRNIPLFFATAPDDDDVTITIDIPYSQVWGLNPSGDETGMFRDNKGQ